MTSYAQRKSSQAYRDRRKLKGERQHLVFLTDRQWAVVQVIVKALRNLNLDGLTAVDVDDDGKYIRFIYDNQPETRVVLPNQCQDDKM